MLLCFVRRVRSIQEDEKLLQLRGQENKSFAKIAEQIEGRSYNDVKNRWSQISRQIAALKVCACYVGWNLFVCGETPRLAETGRQGTHADIAQF